MRKNFEHLDTDGNMKIFIEMCIHTDCYISLIIWQSLKKWHPKELLEQFVQQNKIFHAEFQVNYVEVIPKRKGNITFHYFSWDCAEWLPWKEYGMKKGTEKSTFAMERPTTNSPKWSRSASAVINHVENMYPWYDLIKVMLYLCDFPLKTP